MGRTRREVRRTALSVAEGSRDASFQGHLKKLYHSPHKDVTVKNAHGGCPSKIVNYAIRVSEHISYDECHATFDTDSGEEAVAEAEALAFKKNICVHESYNIENELLDILKANRSRPRKKSPKATKEAKKVLQKACRLKRVNDEIDWHRYFPKNLLDQARQSNKWLDDQIKIFEN